MDLEGVHEAVLQGKHVCKDMDDPSYRALAVIRTEIQGKQMRGSLTELPQCD